MTADGVLRYSMHGMDDPQWEVTLTAPPGGDHGGTGLSFFQGTIEVWTGEHDRTFRRSDGADVTATTASVNGGQKVAPAGDIEQAVRNFAETSRDSFRQQFTAIAKALPRIVSEMGEATLVEVRGDRAIYDLRTVRNGSIYSFQLEFVREGDGIWRIRSF